VQTETVIIMIVGLLAIGLIRLVIAMVGREYAADHPHQKKTTTDGSTTGPDVPLQRPMRGTGRKSHLLYLPAADETAAIEVPGVTSDATPRAS
jgi:hypothetical protein